MYNHCIILGSAYSIGKRIALHYTNLNEVEMKEKLDFITKKCGYDIFISTHYIMTDEESWESVVNFDKYFLGVKLGSTSVFRVGSSGELYYARVDSSRGVRPVINLSPNVSITGSGTSTDPYLVN